MALLYGAVRDLRRPSRSRPSKPLGAIPSERGTVLTPILRSGIVPRAIFVAILGLNIGLTLHIALGFQVDRTWPDWEIFATAGERLVAGLDPYAFGTDDHTFRWSPLLAYVAALITPLGPWLWSLVAIASLALLRDWRLAAVFLLAYPFWIDLAAGASFWFLPLIGILAMRGSTGAALAIAAIAALIPRPIMIPLLLWLWWRRPDLRLPALAIIGACIIGSVATGWGDEWIGRLLETSTTTGGGWSLHPFGILGPLWFVMLPVAVWLTWKGHVGLASMAAAPYWLPSYYLMLLLEPIVVSGRIWSVLGGGDSDAPIASATSIATGDEKAARQSGGP